MASIAADAPPVVPGRLARLRQLPALLAPASGRLPYALRLTLVCTLSAAIALAAETPDPALTAYIGFFMLRPDRTTSVILGGAFVVLISLLIGFLTLLAGVVVGRPAALVVTMTLIAFGLLFLTAASKLRPVGAILALVTTYALSLLGRVPEGELATRALLYAWLFVAIPAGVSIAVHLLFGTAPRRLAERALAERLGAAAALLRRGDSASRARLEALRGAGSSPVEGWLKLAALEHTSTPQDLNALRQAADATTRVLLLVETLDGRLHDGTARAAIAGTLEGMAQILARGGYPVDIALAPLPAAPLAPPVAQALAALRETLAGFAETAGAGTPAGTAAATPPPPREPKPESEPPAHAGFMAPDAFTSPAATRFALKATGAAMACYLIYNALDWPGIHTAFITCFIVALGTTAETVQKLNLRITGCLAGAALGLAALIWVLPDIDGVSGLLALLFAVTLPAAWIAGGSQRIAYLGFQLAFAFYLCVLQGSAPAYDLAVARDRVVGILLGNAMVYVIFTRLWPVSVATRIDPALAQLLHRLARVASAAGPQQAAVQATQVQGAYNLLRTDLDLLAYEPPRVRPDAAWMAQRARVLDAARALEAPLQLLTGAAAPPPGRAVAAPTRTLEALAAQLDDTASPTEVAPAPAPAAPDWLAGPLDELTQAVRSIALARDEPHTQR